MSVNACIIVDKLSCKTYHCNDNLSRVCITMQGCEVTKQNSPFLACSYVVSRVGGGQLNFTCSRNLHSHLLSCATNYRRSDGSTVSRNFFGRNPLQSSSLFDRGGLYVSNKRSAHRARSHIYAAVDVATAIDVINDLGMDTLTLLAVTVIVVPAFKLIKASPVRL